MKRKFLLFFIFVVKLGGCNNSTNNKEDYTIDLETISDGEMIELKRQAGQESAQAHSWR